MRYRGKSPRVLVALHHAALDLPTDAIAHWRSIVPEAFLSGPLPFGAIQLLPLVWRNLNAASEDGDAMPLLKGLARRTWLVNSAALDELETALGALAAASIATTLLGGLATAMAPWGWSGDLKYRSLADTGVMVSAEDRDRAVEAMRGAGWSTGSDRRVERHHRLWREIQMTSPAELNLRLVWEPSRWLTGSGWWDEGPAVSVGGVASRVLGATDAFLVTCIDGWMLPSRHPLWIADAHEIARAADVDLARCTEVATRSGVEAHFAAALSLLAQEFGTPMRTAAPMPPRDLRRGAIQHAMASPASLRADWRSVRRGLGARSLAILPAFLADRWQLEEARRVPREAWRRTMRRLRRSG